MAETTVRMGEYAVASRSGDVLVTIGLGSCIGLALIDRRRGVAGLAHIMLPDSSTKIDSTNSARYADVAVPTLVASVVKAGASQSALEAVLVGGAKMFAMGGDSLDIGARNDASTRALLAAQRIPIIATETGGTKGRTIRVFVDGPRVTSRVAGGTEVELVGADARSNAA
ncbi:MAG: chemotaxis protein CheD [Gaiellales bacterium]